MQIPVLSNIPHSKWWPGFWYYNDGSALDNSSEGPKICNYSAVAPDPSIMALSDSPWEGNTTVSDRLWWALVVCCCCLFRLRNTKIDTQQENNTEGRKFPKLQNFPTMRSQVFWPLTSTLRSEHFPKHNQSILKQRKIIPQRNVMSRPLNVSLFCQHELLPPAILWKTLMISFLLLSVMNPTLI